MQFKNKSPSSEPSQACGLPVVSGMCTSISDIGCWPMCFPNPPAPKAAMVPQAYLVCAMEGTQFPGLRAGSGAHRSPATPARDSHSELHVGLFCAVGEASHYAFR